MNVVKAFSILHFILFEISILMMTPRNALFRFESATILRQPLTGIIVTAIIMKEAARNLITGIFESFL